MYTFPELPRTDTENGRFYQLPSGRWVPSVTTVTGSIKKDAVAKWRERVGEEEAKRVLNRASVRGSQFHDLCEQYLINREVRHFPDSIIKETFLRFRPFLDQIGELIAVEQTLYSERLRIAGRADCIAYFEGEPHVIDFKTSRTAKQEYMIENYFLQCCAYSTMMYEMTGLKISNFVVAVISDDMPQPQLFRGKCFKYLKRLIEVRKQFPDWSTNEE